MIHHYSAINGAAFKGSIADGSYVDCPFDFVLEPGKSIGFWVNNYGSAVQVAFRSANASSLVYFSSGELSVKTSTGSLYTLVTSIAAINELAFFMLTITADNELKVFTNDTEHTLATLASGEVLDFSTGILLGKGGGGIGNLACAMDDVTFWNRSINLNEAKVMCNHRSGVSPNRLPFALPVGTGLKHYLSFDNMGLIKDEVSDVITGTVCKLKGSAYEYFNQSAVFFFTPTDYVVGAHSSWDNSALTTQNNLVFTFIVRPDITLGTAQALEYSPLCTFGATDGSDYFRIYYGNPGSGTDYMAALLDGNSVAFNTALWNPDGDEPISYPAGEYFIQSWVLTPTASYLIHNGILVHTEVGFPMPLLTHANYAAGYRLGNLPHTYDHNHYGTIREHSIIKKVVTVDQIINLHKAYLGLAPEDSAVGADTSVLKTTTYNLMTDGGYGQADLIGYWPGFRVDGWGEPSITGTTVKDVSGNNRHLDLVNYTFPTDPTVKRRGNKIIS